MENELESAGGKRSYQLPNRDRNSISFLPRSLSGQQLPVHYGMLVKRSTSDPSQQTLMGPTGFFNSRWMLQHGKLPQGRIRRGLDLRRQNPGSSEARQARQD
jgi:hypothetical protein